MQRWESVRKLIAIILIPFLLAIPSFATGESCPEQLNISGELTHQIDQMINATPGWFARRRLAKSLAQMQPKLADRITKVCGSVANCSAQDLALATSVSLREALATLDSPTQSLLRPFCGLVVALATNAGLQILLSQSLPQIMPAQYATVVASSINTFTTILIFALGAPILERLQNRVRQWALKERTVTSTTKNPHLDGFDGHRRSRKWHG
ncbi:MAG: hypothetical protein HYR96_03730 [Deltaproteobacteria bacterium]|nr:hypothetical protein [Deltaproteobacteria bacterium]